MAEKQGEAFELQQASHATETNALSNIETIQATEAAMKLESLKNDANDMKERIQSGSFYIYSPSDLQKLDRLLEKDFLILSRKIAEYEQENIAINNNISEYRKEISYNNTKIKKYKEDNLETEKELDKYKKAISAMLEEIARYKNTPSYNNENRAKYNETVSKYEDSLLQLNNAIKQYEAKIIDKNIEITRYQQGIIKLDKKVIIQKKATAKVSEQISEYKELLLNIDDKIDAYKIVFSHELKNHQAGVLGFEDVNIENLIHSYEFLNLQNQKIVQQYSKENLMNQYYKTIKDLLIQLVKTQIAEEKSGTGDNTTIQKIEKISALYNSIPESRQTAQDLIERVLEDKEQ